MYSAVLESFDSSDFLRLVYGCSMHWETDAVFTGGKEGESVCFICPQNRFEVGYDTTADKLRSFVSAGGGEVFGFLSYDFGMKLRGVVSEKELTDEPGLFKKYAARCVQKYGTLSIESELPALTEKIITAYESAPEFPVLPESGEARCSMTAEEYVENVRRVLEYIRDGHTYQLNLSMKYEADTEADPYALWADMAKKNPAPFYSIFSTGKGVIISTSPERFLKLEDGAVLSEPIKGTHRFEEYCEGIEKVLTDSAKETAELSMIVDLIRNDISEVCRAGSVRVSGHKSVMCVDNLLQMFSCVHGELSEGKDAIDLLFSAFPGGSVTGCPKKRSMELIDRLEPHTRGVYCGSMVRIKDLQNMDSSITIRTAFHSGGKLAFYAGSGIVADSVPEKEYAESVSKAEKFLRL